MEAQDEETVKIALKLLERTRGRMRKSYEKNREERLEKVRNHYKENKEAIIARQMSYYNDNKEAINEKRRLAYQKKKADKLNEKKVQAEEASGSFLKVI